MITPTKGSAMMMATFLIATNPPLKSKTIAIDDNTTPQITLIFLSGFKSPFRENMAITKFAESAEVTKNVTIKTVAMKEISLPKGRCDKVTNKPTATSLVIASAT